MNEKWILIFVIIGLSGLAGIYFYQKNKADEVDSTFYEVRATIPIQLYRVSENKQAVPLKYKLIPAGTSIWVAPNEWLHFEVTGFYFKVRGNDVAGDLYAGENINSFLPADVASDNMVSALTYHEVFPIDEYKYIPYRFKNCIATYFQDNEYQRNKRFSFTGIKNRVNDVICYGNFTGNKEIAIAILIEDAVRKSSQLAIFRAESAQDCQMLYEDNFDGFPVINTFRKNALIYLDGTKLQRAPNEGLIIRTQNEKYAVVYDPVYKKFDRYYQYSDKEIKEIGF